MERPTTSLPHIPLTWLSSIRTFLRDIDGHLQMPDASEGVPKNTRTSDTCLMEAVLNLPKGSNADIRAFQRVRLHLGVTLLSEITTADGQFITREAWIGTRARHSPLLWPFQPLPGRQSIRVWQLLLARSFFSTRAPTFQCPQKSLALTHRLGHWLPGSSWLQTKWVSFYSYETHLLYWRCPVKPHLYMTHQRLGNSRLRNPKFEPDPALQLVPLPPNAIPVDAQAQPSSIAFPSISRLQFPPDTPGNALLPATFPQYIKALPAWDRLLVQDVHQADLSMQELLELLANPGIELILGSDGGARDPVGSFGAVMASQQSAHGTQDRIILEIGGYAYGLTPSSFRAESYGQLAILRLLFHIKTYFKIPLHCEFRFLLDNSGRISRTATLLRNPNLAPRRCLISDFDLDMQILDTLQQLGITPKAEHVHSHQEEALQADGEPLPWAVQINTRCDEIATDYLRRQSTPVTTVPFLPASKVAVVVNDITLNGRIPSHIRHHCGARLEHNKRSQLQHLQKIHHWTESQLDSVDWDTFHTTTNSKASFGTQHFLLRWANQILPLMERQHRWGLAASGDCPSGCGGDEDEPHLLRCPHLARQPPRTSLHKALVATFNSRHADPWLRQILLSFLALCDPSIQYNLAPLTPPYQRLLAQQSALGAESLFYGYFHKSWVRLQHNYLCSQSLPCEQRQAKSLVATWAHLLIMLRQHWVVSFCILCCTGTGTSVTVSDYKTRTNRLLAGNGFY